MKNKTKILQHLGAFTTLVASFAIGVFMLLAPQSADAAACATTFGPDPCYTDIDTCFADGNDKCNDYSGKVYCRAGELSKECFNTPNACKKGPNSARYNCVQGGNITDVQEKAKDFDVSTPLTACSNNLLGNNTCHSSVKECDDAGGRSCTVYDGTVYCRINDPQSCHTSLGNCNDGPGLQSLSCVSGADIESVKTAAKTAQNATGDPNGQTFCEVSGDRACSDSLSACRAIDGRNCEESIGPVYCRAESGECFARLIECTPLGLTNCIEGEGVQDALAKAGGVSNVNSGGGATGNARTGAFIYKPLEKSFISDENAASLPKFLKFIFNVGIAIVGIAALLMMTVGGLTYITSAGNNATAETAKKMIRDAALGLILAFSSWIILFVVNPDLVGIDENLEKLTVASQYLQEGGVGTNNTGFNLDTDNDGVPDAVDNDGDGQPDVVQPSDSCAGGGCATLGTLGLPNKGAATCQAGNTCQIRSDVGEKLTNLDEDLGDKNINWRITEAWPPTGYSATKPNGIHANDCHGNATCVDANFTGGTTANAQNINAFLQSASGSGLRAVYEVAGNTATGVTRPAAEVQAQYDGLIASGVPSGSIQIVQHARGNHFSVYSN